MVPREELGRANGWLVGAQTVMERFVGAPVAGVLVATSLAAAFLGPAGLYLLAALVLARLPGHYRPPARPPAKARRDIAEGLRFLSRHPTLRALAVLGGVLNLATTAYFSVFVLFAVGDQSPMGLPEEAYGLLWAGLAAGSVIGSISAGRLERSLGPRRTLLGTMRSSRCCWPTTPVLTSQVLPVATMLAAVGFLAAAANIVSVSSRQRIVPEALLGRVNSAYRLLGSGGQPLGAILGGLLAQTVGLLSLFAIVATAQLAVLLAVHAPITDAALGANHDPDANTDPA
jgi:predicted MFS family arabinose efflux permease